MSLLRYRSAYSSLRGRRPVNQDAVLDERLPDGRHLVALADGMGGHSRGEVASEVALQALRAELCAGRGLQDSVRAANRVVHEQSLRDPSCQGMGTTLVALLRSGAVYEIANVGDSRAYRVDRGGVQQITADHSFSAEALRAGQMTRDEIDRSPWRNALTRSVGTQAEVAVDCFGPFEIVGAPHAVLLCSDGLYRAVSASAIHAQLLSGEAVDSTVLALSHLALRNGSDDNISLAVVEFGSVAPERLQPRAPAQVPSPVGSVPVVRPTAEPVRPRPERLTAAQPVRRRNGRHWTMRLFSNDVLFAACSLGLLAWLAAYLLDH